MAEQLLETRPSVPVWRSADAKEGLIA